MWGGQSCSQDWLPLDRPIVSTRGAEVQSSQLVKARPKIGPVKGLFNRPISLVFNRLGQVKLIGRLKDPTDGTVIS
jgi:hypothetical protein